MSVLLKDQDDGIIETISKSENVKSVEIARNGRINLRIDSFDDMAVQNVLNTIISSGGIITSIFTEEPSLEDVFIKSTSEVNEDDRA
jgi:ABC-2 type transport system ATP-binding protein